MIILECMDDLAYNSRLGYALVEDDNNGYVEDYDCLDLELGHVPGYSEEHESICLPNNAQVD